MVAGGLVELADWLAVAAHDRALQHHVVMERVVEVADGLEELADR